MELSDSLNPSDSEAGKSAKPDLLDLLDQIGRRDGNVQAVGPHYYASFAALQPDEVERITMVLMLNHEKEVRRISKGSFDDPAIEAVSGFVERVFFVMEVGLGAIDGFGTFVMTARDGQEPTAEESAAMEHARESFRPWITDAVRRFLPWQLAQGNRQPSLAL
jgi:hypothetical protein